VFNKPLRKLAFLAIATGLSTPAPVFADPPAPGRRGPAIYADWRLDCRDAPCTAYGPVFGTDGSEVLRLALPRGGSSLVVRTPLAIYLPDGVTLALGGRLPQTATWRTCGPEGCEAWLPLDAELLEGVRNERIASVTFTLAEGTPVRVAVSLRGSSAALRARDPELRRPRAN
jgi:invasion protein IalB